MKLRHCANDALKKLEERMPEINLTEEESHKLKSLGAFLMMAVVVVIFNRLGR